MLAFAKQQWEAVGGKVKAHIDIDENKAYLVVQEVPFAIVALVREAVDLGPEISRIPDEGTTPGRILAMKEELIECINGPDISDAEVEVLYEILASPNKEPTT